MDPKTFATVFVTVFLAELGDKTQLATVVFSGKADGGGARLGVFLAASLALVASTALGVLGGAALGHALDPRWLTRAAGVGFLVIGAWTLWTA